MTYPGGWGVGGEGGLVRGEVVWSGGWSGQGAGLIRGEVNISPLTRPPALPLIRPPPPRTSPPPPVTMWPIPWCIWCHLPPSWTEWVTHACENITFARFATWAVKKTPQGSCTETKVYMKDSTVHKSFNMGSSCQFVDHSSTIFGFGSIIIAVFNQTCHSSGSWEALFVFKIFDSVWYRRIPCIWAHTV